MLGQEGAALSILTAFVILIIVGLIIAEISRKLRISNILLLILTGLLLGQILSDSSLFFITNETVLTIAVLTLVLVVFDGSSRFKVKSLDTLSFSALRLTGIFLSLNLVFVSIVTLLLFFEFSLINLFYALVFSSIISGTDPASVFIMLHNRTNKVLELLKIEGILNTPIMVLLPFILLDVLNQILTKTTITISAHFSAILTQILVGIGAGILVGLIFFKGIKKFSEQTASLTLICSALLSFILAENLGGNGVLAVAVLGFMFGSFYITKKEVMQDFNSMLSNSLEILVFVMIGFIVQINIDLMFLIKSFIIFLTLILTRFAAVKLTFSNKKYTNRELLYMTLNMPKGIAVAVLIFSLSLIKVPQIAIINNLLVLVVIYSLLLSTIVNKFSEKFINMKL